MRVREKEKNEKYKLKFFKMKVGRNQITTT